MSTSACSTPSGIAGPGGTYFHKYYGGTTKPKLGAAAQRAALLHIARHAVDQEDFASLVAMLGLDDLVNTLRVERRIPH